MDRLRAWPTAAIGKYCWWHETQSCLLTCRRNASRELAEVTCKAANAFSAAEITVESSSLAGRVGGGGVICGGGGSPWARAPGGASTPAAGPLFPAPARGVGGPGRNAPPGPPPAAFGSA